MRTEIAAGLDIRPWRNSDSQNYAHITARLKLATRQAHLRLPSENAAGGHSAPRSWPVQKWSWNEIQTRASKRTRYLTPEWFKIRRYEVHSFFCNIMGAITQWILQVEGRHENIAPPCLRCGLDYSCLSVSGITSRNRFVHSFTHSSTHSSARCASKGVKYKYTQLNTYLKTYNATRLKSSAL